MPFSAQSSEMVLLHYLLLRAQVTGVDKAPIPAVAREFADLQRDHDVTVYELPGAKPTESRMLRSDLRNLEARALVRLYSNNPHVELTGLGRLFAQLCQPPSKVLEGLEEIARTSASSGR